MSAAAYKRIGAGGRGGQGLLAKSSVWLGPDHLLIIEGDGYTESYRRFYFRDIQSIVVRRDNRRRNINILFGVLLGLVAIGFIFATFFAARVSFGIAGAILLLPILYNTLRGPTCVCHLRTAVQHSEIQGIRRLRAVEKFLPIIREAVAAHEELLQPDQIVTLLATQIRAVSSPPPLPEGLRPLP